MVFKKYTYKNGKRYGPYLYENKRVGDKVVTVYLGPAKSGRKLDRKNVDLLIGGFGILAVLLLLFFVFQSGFFGSTGKVSLDVEESYVYGEILSGNLKFNVKQGELVPKSSIVKVSLGGSVRDFVLSELVDVDFVEGDFYAEGVEIGGSGEGYGIIGEMKVYPDVDFDLRIFSSGDEGSSEDVIVGGGGSYDEDNASGKVEKKNDSVGSVDSGDVVNEGEGQEKENDKSKDSADSVDGGIKDGDVPDDDGDVKKGRVEKEKKESDKTKEGEVIDEGVGNDDSGMVENKDSLDSIGSSSGDEAAIPEASDDSDSSGGSSNDGENNGGKDGGSEGGETQESGDVGVVTGAIVSENEFIVSGVVRKGKDFVYNLEEGQSAEIVSGSVSVNASGIDESNLKLKVKKNNVEVSTKYSIVEGGFGENYLGDKTLKIEISLEEFGLNVTGSNLKIELVYGEEILVGVEKGLNIVVDGINESEKEVIVNVSNVNETVEIVSNVSVVNVSVSNLTGVNVSVQTTQYGAILGKPVRWVKNVSIDGPVNVTVEVPLNAENVSVRKMDKTYENLNTSVQKEMVGEIRVDVEGNVLLGKVTAEIDLGKESVIVRWFKKLLKITGLVVSGDVNVTQEVLVEVTEAENGFEVEYYTDAPYSEEDVLEKGKRVKVFGPDDVHYENVLVFSELDESLGIADVNKFRIYWVERGVYVGVENLADRDGNGIYDYVEWIAPHLSNQTFEIILITQAEHLDSNRSLIEDIYDLVKEKDGNWTDVIPVGDYVRVTFERNLTEEKDITLWARSDWNNVSVEVYEQGGGEIIANFSDILEEGEYKIYLDGSSGRGLGNRSQDSFDLLITGLEGGIKFDWIVDPTIVVDDVNSYNSVNTNVTTEADASAHISTSDSNLVAYWSFDRVNQSQTVYDLTDYNVDGTILGGANINSTGYSLGGLHIDGIDDDSNGINLNSNLNMNITKNFTFLVWAKPVATPSHGGILARGSIASGATSMNYVLQNQGTTWRVQISNGASLLTAAKSISVDVGVWQHIVARWNGTTLSLYKDNVMLIESVNAAFGDLAGLGGTSGNVGIGGDFRNSRFYFNGSIDELMIFNRSLSLTEISDIFNNQSARFKQPATQLFEGLNFTQSGSDNRVNVTYNTTLNFGTTMQLRIRELNGGTNTANTTWQSLTDGDNQLNIFNISTTTNNLTLEFNYTTDANKFYTPILRDNIDIDVWAGAGGPAADNEYPLFSNFWDDNGSILDSGTANFNVTLQSTNGTVFLEMDSANYTAHNISTNVFNVSISVISGGVFTYYWGAWGNGTSSNYNTTSENLRYYTVNITPDTTPPVVTINFPKNSTYSLLNLSFNFNVSLNENGSVRYSLDEGINNVSMFSTDEGYSLFGLLFNDTNGSIAEGGYTFSVYANDTSGNNNWTSSVVFNFQALNPNIVFQGDTPEGGSMQAHSSIIVNLSTLADTGDHYVLVDFDGSLVGWWRLGNLSSLGENDTLVVDESRYSNNGTVENVIHTQVNSSGYFGGGFSFDGIDDSTGGIYLGTSDILNLTGNFTISVWAYPYPRATNHYTLFARGSVGSSADTMNYALQDATNGWKIQISNGTSLLTSVLGLSVVDNVWQHIVASWNGTTLSLYKNGTLIDNAVDIGFGNIAGIGGGSNANTGIGGDFRNNRFYWNGSIDEVLVFNRSLSAVEVLALYNASANQYFHNFTNLSQAVHTFTGHVVDLSGNKNSTAERIVTVVPSWPLINFTAPTPENATISTNTSYVINMTVASLTLSNVTYNWNGADFNMFNNDSLRLLMNLDNRSEIGESQTLAVDLSVYSNNGTPAATATPGATARQGLAYTFDGNSDYIDLNEPASLKLYNFTLMAWFRRTGAGVAGSTGTGGITDCQPLVTKGRGEADGDNRDANYALCIDVSENVIRADFESTEASSNNYPISATTTISNNVWYHAAVSYNGSDWRIYTNGVMEATSVVGKVPRGDSIQDNAIATMMNSAGTPAGYFQGQIDEVRIYQGALTDAEVYQHYASTLTRYNQTFWNLEVNQSQDASTGLGTGNYTYQGIALDDSGTASKTDFRTLQVITTPDNTAPVVTINFPENITYAASSLPFNFNVSLNENGSVMYSLDGGLNNISMFSTDEGYSSFGLLFNDTNGSIAYSGYTFSVYANDTSGNNNYTASIDFGVKLIFDPFYDGVSIGNLDSSANWQEISGIARIQNTSNAGFIWGQSDGSVDLLLAINLTDASNAGEWTLSGINGVDYEDLSSATINGTPYVYLADIGDNADARGTIVIYRIKEPTINGTNGVISAGDIETITAQYPGGALPTHKDAETLLVDPYRGDMYVITKRESIPGVYSLAHNATYGGTQTLVFEGDMWNVPTESSTSATGNAVGGDISDDGLEILIKSYDEAFLFQRADNTTTIFNTLNSTPINLSSYVGGGNTVYRASHPSQEPQGEAVTFSTNGSNYYSASEYVATEGSTAARYPFFNYVRTTENVTTVAFQDGLYPNASYNGTRDTYLWDAEPTTNHGGAATFVVDINVADERRGLLRFDLSSIPSNATIIGARVDLDDNTEGQGWTFHRILSIGWNESSTYNDVAGGAGIDADGIEASTTEDNRNGVTLDTYTGTVRNNVLVDTVQSWVNGSQPNYGWLILATHATDGQQFSSKENETASYRPKLTLRYITASAVADTTAPVVTINFPANTTYSNSDLPLNFNVSLNENGSVMYSLDGGLNNISMFSTDEGYSSFGLLFNDTNGSIADGGYTFSVYANDTTGNTNNTASIVFSYSSVSNNAPTAPTPSINSTDGSNKTTQDLNCYDVVVDPDGEPMNVSVRWYNGSALHFEEDYNTSYANNSLFVAVLDSANTTKGENWTCGIRLYDGTDYSSWVNTSLSVNITNSIPSVPTLLTPSDGSNTTNRAPNFTWSASTDDDGDSITYELNVTLVGASTCSEADRYVQSISGNSHKISGDLQCLYDNGDYYNWSVRAYDGDEFSIWASFFSVNISAEVIISLPNSSVSFGSIEQGGSNDTIDNSPGPLVIQNDGNVFVNITLNATNLWLTQANPTSYYQFKIDNSSELGAFNWVLSVIGFTNVPAAGLPILAIAELNYTNATDSAEIDFNITVPPDEQSGDKSSTLTFIASLAE